MMRIKRQEADVLVCLSYIKIEIVPHQNTCLVYVFIIKPQREFRWLHLQYLCQAGIFSCFLFFPSSIDKRVWGEGTFQSLLFLSSQYCPRKENAVNITNQVSYWVCNSSGRRDRKQNCTGLEIVVDGFPDLQN